MARHSSSSSSRRGSGGGGSSRRRIARRALPMTMGLLLSLPTAAVLGLKFRAPTTHNPFVAPPAGGPPHGHGGVAGPWMMAPQGFLLPLPRTLALAGASKPSYSSSSAASASGLVPPVASIISSGDSGGSRVPFVRHRSQRGMGGGMTMICTASATAAGGAGAEGEAAVARGGAGAGGSGGASSGGLGGWRGLLSAFRGGVGSTSSSNSGTTSGPSSSTASSSASTSLRILSSSYAAWNGAAPGALQGVEGGILSFLPPGIPTDVPTAHVTAAADGGPQPRRAGAVGAGGKRKKKVLILMSDTGGGHRASAQALEAAFDELFPNQIECSTVDIWTDFAPWPYNQFVPAYQFMAKNPFYWKAFWEYGKFPPSKWGTEELSNLACHHRFKDCIEAQDPDLVISVHPLCQDVPLRVLNTIGNGTRKIPFVTVVTDLGGAHPTWFHKEVDLCFVPSDPVRRIALSMGLKPDQLRQHGLPIRPGFWKATSKDKAALRRELGVQNARTALVVGGGDGIGNLKEITESMVAALSKDAGGKKSQIVVVCGKNEEMKRSLEAGKWPPNVNVVVKGFVNNMDAWMGASDCIVTKAGPGTIAEASTRGLPVMLFNFLPGQEEGNVPYVIENGFGDYKKDPKAIAKVVSSWLGSDDLRTQLSKKALEASRPSSTTDIAKEIGDILFGEWQPPRRRDTEDKFNMLLKKITEPVTM